MRLPPWDEWPPPGVASNPFAAEGGVATLPKPLTRSPLDAYEMEEGGELPRITVVVADPTDMGPPAAMGPREEMLPAMPLESEAASAPPP